MLAIDPRRHALFLDLDGTLIAIGDTPSGVVVPPELVSTLTAVVDVFEGAVAIVTGRPIFDADQLLSPLKLVTAGVHGIELRLSRDGAVKTIAPMLPTKLLSHIRSLTSELEGIVIEPKGAAVAVHYRQAPAKRELLESALQKLVVTHGQHLELSQGRMVYEVIPRAYSKGGAIQTLMELPQFAGRIPVMVGDDAPDVSAHTVAIQLGGLGLKVGGEYFPAETSDFTDASHVRAWLRKFIQPTTCR